MRLSLASRHNRCALAIPIPAQIADLPYKAYPVIV